VESLRKSGLTKLVLIFVPGHAGFKGNERADRLAESAIVDRQWIADILNAIRDARREAGSISENEPETISRLIKH
jgi:ribonuclease HI